MTLWQHFQTSPSKSSRPKSNTPVNDDLARDLESLAEREGCTPDEIILLLLNQGLEAHRQSDHDHRSWERLSAREKQVAALMCDGLTNRQIAARLVISPETVKTHVRHLLRKFNLRARKELRARLKDWDLSEWREDRDC
ncbi:MAG: helix-turn-helix transcriptional regulator [Chloroflexi bacterium]|nr:helix-turn-helix transcriptional regulator [Chloroflexota bacterium]